VARTVAARIQRELAAQRLGDPVGQAPRRARAAAVAIARARLVAVQTSLAPSAGERAGEAIRSSRPIVPETAAGKTGKVLVIVTPQKS